MRHLVLHPKPCTIYHTEQWIYPPSSLRPHHQPHGAPQKLTMGLVQKDKQKENMCYSNAQENNYTGLNSRVKLLILNCFHKWLIWENHYSLHMTKIETIAGWLALFSGEGFFFSLSLVSSAHPWHFPALPLICLTFIKVVTPVVFAERIRMRPWQRMKEKSTGIKFQCNCLLNCGLQLLKFYPRFCVTTAVMNSVWLWFSHWRHIRFELEKERETARAAVMEGR